MISWASHKCVTQKPFHISIKSQCKSYWGIFSKFWVLCTIFEIRVCKSDYNGLHPCGYFTELWKWHWGKYWGTHISITLKQQSATTTQPTIWHWATTDQSSPPTLPAPPTSANSIITMPLRCCCYCNSWLCFLFMDLGLKMPSCNSEIDATVYKTLKYERKLDKRSRAVQFTLQVGDP